eukprot:m.93660 g.93660  ORF g.93660 m.93660 type:complete len:390 (+) comp14709_c0_seq2:79-1248(+)
MTTRASLSSTSSEYLQGQCDDVKSDCRESGSAAFGTTRADTDDEYGVMNSEGKLFSVASFQLESGVIMKNVNVNVNTYGTLNADADNAIVVCHALTGNAAVHTWWAGLFGNGNPLDTSKYFVVCANILGSCYGTTGPSCINPETGKRYGSTFPAVTVRDCARLHHHVLTRCLGIRSFACVIGGSLGGMQTLEWSQFPNVKSFVVMACNAAHTPWQIGISEAQRQAIYADPLWNGGDYDHDFPPKGGLAVARQMAMVFYRTHKAYSAKFGRDTTAEGEYQVCSYLHYQGNKFIDRFDASCYVAITKMMDTHDMGRGRGDISKVLAETRQPCLIIGIDSDILYPLSEQQQLAAHLPGSIFVVIESVHGHDGFLLEQKQINAALLSFLETNK